MPPELNPGEGFRLIFVTSGSVSGGSINIADYNNFVGGDVIGNLQLSALGAEWYAVVSTSGVYAQNNTWANPAVNGVGVPIYNLVGERVASSYADLWDGLLDTAVEWDRDGNRADSVVWTGSTASGTSAGPGNAMGVGAPTVGNPLSATWWLTENGTYDKNTLFPVYAISDVLFTIPEPSAMIPLILLPAISVVLRSHRPNRRVP